jgi:hypothetical protein
VDAVDDWRRNVTKVTIKKNRFCGRGGPTAWLEYVPKTGRLVELESEEVAKYEAGGVGGQVEEGWGD